MINLFWNDFTFSNIGFVTHDNILRGASGGPVFNKKGPAYALDATYCGLGLDCTAASTIL